MAENSKIEWCDATWNVARGCTKVDEDCKYCYMYRDSFDSKRYNPKQVIKTKTVFDFPLKYKETKSKAWGGRPLIFTSSLTDVFHPDIDSYRHEILEIIKACPHLIFQVLTKRPERITHDWNLENVWIGTSIGSNNAIERGIILSTVPAHTRFLSLEPLHTPLNDLDDCFVEIDLGHEDHSIWTHRPDWVIVGGESGNESGKYRYRECKLTWIFEIADMCEREGIPLFVKQLGTYLAKELKLKDRHGRDITEWPESLQIRQFPQL